MREIRHTFQIKAAPEELLKAITRGEEIAQWWTTSANLLPEEGAVGLFQWSNYHWTVEILLKKLRKDELVIWKCTSSNMQDTDAWEGSEMEFRISKLGHRSVKLDFLHANYKESPCFDVCNDGWRFVLGNSLKSYLETGKGFPYKS